MSDDKSSGGGAEDMRGEDKVGVNTGKYSTIKNGVWEIEGDKKSTD